MHQSRLVPLQIQKQFLCIEMHRHHIVYSISAPSFEPSYPSLQLQQSGGRGKCLSLNTCLLIGIICSWQSRMKSSSLFSFRPWYIQL